MANVEGNIKARYEALMREDMARANGKSGEKAYRAEDIRSAISGIFAELEKEGAFEGKECVAIPMAVCHKMMKEEARFKELRYQEIRSVVKAKNFKGFELRDIDGRSVVARV